MLKTFPDKPVQQLEGSLGPNTVPVQSLAVDAELVVGINTTRIKNALLVVVNVTDNDMAIFPLENGAIGTAIHSNTDITTTKGTDNKINVYVESDEVELQNTYAAAKNISLSVLTFGV